VTIAAYQFRGGGWILSIVSDGAISPETGMYITAIVIVLFTAAAGMVSIVTVDVFNGIIITLGVLFALPYMVFELGGIGAVTSALPAQHMEPLGGHNVLWVFGVAAPTFLLILGESGMYQKFFSAKNENAARKAVLGMVAGIVIIEVALALLAIVGRAAFPDLMESTSIVGRAGSETVILYIARHGLPLVGAAILLAAAVAIVLSTGNTFLLVPSTNVSRDLYQRFVNPEASEPRMLLVQRLSIAAFGVLALLLITQFDTILAMARSVPGRRSGHAARDRGPEPFGSGFFAHPRRHRVRLRKQRLHRDPGGAGLHRTDDRGEPSHAAFAEGEVGAVFRPAGRGAGEGDRGGAAARPGGTGGGCGPRLIVLHLALQLLQQLVALELVATSAELVELRLEIRVISCEVALHLVARRRQILIARQALFHAVEGAGGASRGFVQPLARLCPPLTHQERVLL
jgi:hypothetical protein